MNKYCNSSALFQVYHSGRENWCPGCTHANWLIGRQLAECAFCHWTLPLLEPAPTNDNPTFYRRGKAA